MQPINWMCSALVASTLIAILLLTLRLREEDVAEDAGDSTPEDVAEASFGSVLFLILPYTN